MIRKYFLPLFIIFFLSLPVFAQTNQISIAYAINTQNQTYHIIPQTELNKIQTALDLPPQNITEDSAAKNKAGFCFINSDGSQTFYTITDSQVLIGNQPLTASIFQRTALEKLNQDLCLAPAQPALLANINTMNITNITADGFGGTNGRIDPDKEIHLSANTISNPIIIQKFIDMLQNLHVQSNNTQTFPKILPNISDTVITVSISFNNGIVYTIAIDNTGLIINSSDGVCAYRYLFPENEPDTIWNIRDNIWDFYTSFSNYTQCAVFQIHSGIREQGVFYSGNDASMAIVSQVLDNILIDENSTNYTSRKDNFMEIYARKANNPKTILVTIDSSQDNWRTIHQLVNGNGTDQLMLLESDDGMAFQLVPIMSELFIPIPKDPTYKPYTTGQKPDYATKGINCRSASAQTTVYPTVLVQQSDLRPWVPAQYNASELYEKLYNQLK